MKTEKSNSSVTGPPKRKRGYPYSPSLCASNKQSYEDCPLKFKKEQDREEGEPQDVAKLAGAIAHKAASIADPDVREEAIVKQLAFVPSEQRDEAERTARELVAAADTMLDEYVGPHDKEKVFRWNDDDPWDPESTGWQLVIKPDELGIVLSDRGGEVLQIADLKSSEKHRDKMPFHAKRQLLFFALVANLASLYDYTGPIRLLVKYMGNGQRSRPLWYSPAATPNNLTDVRKVIRKIEKSAAEDNFEARPGFHCHFCPFAQSCQARAEADARGEIPELPVYSEPDADKVA